MVTLTQSEHKSVFLDRDGVVNEPIIINNKPFSPMRFSDFKITLNLKENLKKLIKLGYKIHVVTNQPEISKGNLDIKELNKMHDYLKKNFPIETIEYCPHIDQDECNCRKPKIGLVKAITNNKKYETNLKESYVIGDRNKDIQMGHVLGCKTIFLDYSYNEKKPISFNHKCNNLTQAVKYVQSQSNY